MRNLKKLHTLLAMLVICLCFTNCSNDDDNGDDSDTSSIVGTWILDEGDLYEKITFNKNGTFYSYNKEYMGDGRWDEWEENGTYSIECNRLFIDFGDESTILTFNVTPKMLTTECKEEGHVHIYYRVED